jgi:hypothetical protein
VIFEILTTLFCKPVLFFLFGYDSASGINIGVWGALSGVISVLAALQSSIEIILTSVHRFVPVVYIYRLYYCRK